MNSCNHEKIDIYDTCLLCYQTVDNTDRYIKINNRLSISPEYAQKLIEEKTQKLMKEKKLSLVLDLDGTIVCADENKQTTDEDIPIEEGFYFVIKNIIKIFIRFRSGLVEFIQKVSKLYEIHVVTLAKKDYASAVVNKINSFPGGPYITGEVITKEDCVEEILRGDEIDDGLIHKDVFEKRDLKIRVPQMGAEDVQVILDDRLDVWNNKGVIQLFEMRGKDENDQELQRVSTILEKNS
ncbi:protein-serine/threonine phosphatase [Entamoeba marina]